MENSGETLRWFASLGVGGVLAGMMYLISRRDWKEARDEAMKHAAQLDILRAAALDDRRLLMDLLRQHGETQQRLATAIDANTAAVTWLVRQDSGRH